MVGSLQTQITSNYLASTLIAIRTSVVILANCVRNEVRKKVGILMRLRNLVPCSTMSLPSCLTLPTASWYGTSVRPPTGGK